MKYGFAEIDSFSGNRCSTTAMMARACPICDELEDTTVVAFDRFQFYTDSAEQEKRATVRQVVCRTCYALYMNPCYSSEGFAVLFAEAGKTYGATEMRKEEQLGWMRCHALLEPGTVLMDVGCYTGDFIGTLPAEVIAVGVDIDAGVIAEAKKSNGTATFMTADFERFEYSGRVDVFTMFHVLEHLPNPKKVLVRLRALAHENTRLVVEVPLLEKAKTNDINGYLTISHLTHFSLNSLDRCLAESGWKVVARTSQADYNGYRILAEPGASAPAGAGDPQDLSRLYDYLAHWYSQLAVASQRLAAIPSEDCVIWGAGFHSELVYGLTGFFQAADQRRFLMIDGDPSKQGKSWRGVPIKPPEILQELDWSRTVLLFSSYGSQEEMAKIALAKGVPADRAFRIYDFIRRY